ncbi:MAG: HlyD family efflux transporter periplasmic adaptor subunit [Rubripirellula sp.]|nr:HlyD family efflux transporter periplasmic adaptor subunit [Rubripirellula sp.]
MTQPLHLTDQAWQDAETLVQRLEPAARQLGSADSFYEDLVCGLRFACGATLTSLSLLENSDETVLARNGITLHASPSSNPESERAVVTVESAVHSQVNLRLKIRFDQSISLATEEHLVDLSDVLLTLAAGVYLRQQFADLRSHLETQASRDRLLSDLNGGTSVEQSFTAIASSIASHVSADRVSLLRVTKHHSQLIATSTQPRVDHRGTIAQSLQDVAHLSRDTDFFVWSHSDTNRITDPNGSDTDRLSSIESHQQSSGCQDLLLQTIRDANKDPIATVILEWIRPQKKSVTSDNSAWQSVREPVETAIRHALDRDQSGWQWVTKRFAITTRKLWLGVASSLAFVVLLTLYPTTLRIPAAGKVVATERARLFAPSDGVVAEILAENHQIVTAGQPLVRLTSPSLDQVRAELEGKLATFRTQLDATLATRSSNSQTRGGRSTSSVAADERVLRTEIEGLENQLALIEQQETELLIRSPLNGEVDGWNLKQSFSGRPIIRGQHLFDVIDPEGAHHIELQLPDRMSGYVTSLSTDANRNVAFRLRSDPTTTYQGVISEMSSSTQQNARGESSIRLNVDLTDSPTQPLRHGATVIAQVDGPKRSIGFVWMRRLIQWSRENIWL